MNVKSLLPDTEIILLLKEPLLNYKSEPFKDYSSLELSSEQLKLVPMDHLKSIAPKSKLGDLMCGIIMINIKPRDGNEAVKLQRWSIKINNKMITDKGELSLDENQLKELINIFTKNPINVENSAVLGAIIYHLQEKETELHQKLKEIPKTNS